MKKFVTFMSFSILICAYCKADDLSIKLVYPTPHAQVEECRDLPFIAEVTQQDTIPIYRVRFFRNGTSFGTVRNAPWERTWTNVYPGYFEIFAEVQDDSGNVAYSDTTWINVGNITTPNLVGNGTFSCSTSPWGSLNVNSGEGAIATWEILSDSWLSDGGIALVSIENGGTANWHVQLHQGVPIDSGHTYILSFKADVSDPRSIDVSFQQNQDPWTVYWQTSVNITEAMEYGPFTFENSNVTDHNNYMRFNIGGSVIGDIYFDDIVVTDASISAVPGSDMLIEPMQTAQYIISTNYPNPFNSSTTIQYQLPEESYVSLAIYTTTGQKIRTLSNGYQVSGERTLVWDGKDQHAVAVPSGIYFYRIDARGRQQRYSLARKIVLIK
jgi:hypothetical protein